MRRHMPVVAVVAATALMGFVPASANATPVGSGLLGFNGSGTFNDRLDCFTESGAGDTWRYFWQDQLATDATGVLAGRWNGDFEVHRGFWPGTAFIPGNDGRIAITVASAGGRSGTAFFDTDSSGSCANNDLTLTQTDPNDDREQTVSGSLPIVATGGLGALRGLSGSGSITLDLQLTAGADNIADIDLTGDLDVLDPQVKVASGFGRWDNLNAYLQKRLKVWVTLRNTAGAGDAFQARITGASGGAGQGFEGLPAGNATIQQGGGATIGFIMRGAQPGKTYTVGVTTAFKDGLLVAQPPVTGNVTFTTPLLP